MDLFEYMRTANMEKESPLAARMRPRTLDEVVGQEHIIGKDKLLYRAIKADKISSVIFYGPPGTGKTTLARVIANTTSAEFNQINATVAGKKDMEEVVARAKELQGMYGRRSILFIDEIHRFNKSQQDYLLPFVEDGTLILIGATTENPYFEVNGALLSRSIIFELKPIPGDAIKELLKKAVYDNDRGMGAYRAVIEEDALDFLADIAGGDARQALNAIELGIMTTQRGGDGLIRITLEVAQECIQKRAVRYDKNGDNHYDTISAFIKSMRGSDPDAAVYYLARMLYAGESVTFIARRIMICAAEDVGNADPQALTVAVNASLAAERVGMPEAQIILAQAVTYVASAPKSNASCNAVFEAMTEVQKTGDLPIPTHLKDAHYKGAAKLGHGTGYKYAHDYPNHYVEQQYLPYELNGREFYRPTQNGYEVKIREHMSRIRREAGQLRSADLFLFMGQSNMAGRGKVCTKWPQTAPPLLPGAGYEFRAVSDPDKLYPIQEPFGVGENREDGINDVFTGNVPAKTGSLVTAFCNAYYEETRVPVIGVSASKGGSLLAQWQPDSPEGYLKDALWRYEKAWNWLKRQGYSVRHRYVLWCQGESDGDRGTTAGEYRRMFDRFLDELCAAGIEKCFLIRIGQCNLPQDKERYEYLIKLQEEIAATDDRVIMVSEAFAQMRERGLMKDAVHYYQQGYNECGKEAGMRAGAYVSRHEEH